MYQYSGYQRRLLGYTYRVRISLGQTNRMKNEVHCTCSCGKARLVVKGPFLGRIKCHCFICQSANRAAFADSTILMARHVPLTRIEHVRFETRKRHLAAQRGFCRSCGCFVLAQMTVLPFLSLAFVPAARYPDSVELPEPVLHVFYESRIADVADELPKHSGKLPSQLAVLRMILREWMGRTGRA
jgi:hypothetical protein